MTDLESDEILEGPKVSSALEFGGTPDEPRKRDNFWFRAFASDSEPHQGFILKVARRPRTRRGQDPHPTLRLMRENPAGMLYAKVKSGEIKVESYVDYTNRMILQAREEVAKNPSNK